MASVKVFPRFDKADYQGKVPIYLRVTKNRKSKRIALDAYIFSKDWNKKTGKVKSTSENASLLNTYISSKIAEAERIALELETRSVFVTSSDIKHKILGRAPADFFEYVENRKDIMDKEYSIGTIRRYKCVVKKLRAFCKRESLYFDDITVTLTRDFQQHLLSYYKNHVNTANANLKVIRRLLIDAVAEGLVPFEKNPFNKIKLKGQSTKRTFLLDDELEFFDFLIPLRQEPISLMIQLITKLPRYNLLQYNLSDNMHISTGQRNNLIAFCFSWQHDLAKRICELLLSNYLTAQRY